jgi:benzil reductase ((S)-benzoin forming)
MEHWIILTGTSRGLGAALLERAIARPASRVFTLNRTPTEFKHPRVEPSVADLANIGELIEGLAGIKARMTELWRDSDVNVATSVLINNAGVVDPVMPLARAADLAIMRAVSVNLTAPLLLMRWYLEHLVPQVPVNRIINISSGAGRRPIASWSTYCATKAALDMVSQVLALEAPQVMVTSLAPGVIDTPMQAKIRNASPEQFADVDRFRELHASGALAAAESVAERILRLNELGLLPAGLADLRTLPATGSD